MPIFPFQSGERSPIDPKSRALLDAMATAYRGLRSLSMDIHVRATSGSREEVQDARLEWQRPDRLALSVGSSPIPRRIVANGGIRIELTGKRSRRRDGIRPDQAVAEALALSELFIAPIVPHLLTKHDAGERLLPGNIVRLGLGNDERLDQMRVAVVVADVATPGGSARIGFAIGVDDKLLRRLHIQSRRGESTLDLSEHYTNVTVNPVFSDSVFSVGSAGSTPSSPKPSRPTPKPQGKRS